MRISAAFPSKYLKAADIPHGREVTCQIEDVRSEEMEQSHDEKPVLYFAGKDKGLVMNVTNANSIADAYGDDTEAWNGKTVIIFGTTTDFQGRSVACLRIRIPKGRSPSTPPLTPTPSRSRSSRS